MRIGAGRFKGHPLPRARAARPVPGRLRTSLFSVLGDRVLDARVLDVCAGVGGLGLEALSRGAADVTLLDRDGGAIKSLDAWLAKVGARSQARAQRRDALRAPLPDGPFDLVFLDPPFAFWQDARAERLLARAISVAAPDGLLILKLPGPQTVPEDPAWRLVRHTRVASVAYALLEPVEVLEDPS